MLFDWQSLMALRLLQLGYCTQSMRPPSCCARWRLPILGSLSRQLCSMLQRLPPQIMHTSYISGKSDSLHSDIFPEPLCGQWSLHAFSAQAVVAPTLLDVGFIDDLQLPDNLCLAHGPMLSPYEKYHDIPMCTTVGMWSGKLSWPCYIVISGSVNVDMRSSSRFYYYPSGWCPY